MYGVLFGSGMMFLMTINALIGVYIIASLIVKYKSCEMYSDLVNKVLGRRARMFLAVIYMINMFGSQITYLLIGNTFLMNLVQAPLANAMGYELNNPRFQTYTEISGLVILITLMIPVNLMKSTAIFKKIGILTVLTLLFTLFTVVYECEDYNKVYSPVIALVKVNNPLVLLQNAGMFTFNTYLLDMIFLLKQDMEKVTKRKIMIVGSSCSLTMFVCYTIIGILGYVSLGDIAMSLDLYIDRPALEGSADTLITIVKIFTIGIMMIAYLTRFIALKVQIFNIASKQITNRNNLVYVLSLLTVPGIIGFVYPSVNSWIGLIGAFCMTTLGFTFPALMAAKEMQIQNVQKWKINAIRLWGIVFTVLGYASTILIILDMAGVQLTS